MDLKDLEKIEEYAACFMRIDEIAVLLGYDKAVFRAEFSKPNSPTAKAYEKGKAFSKFEIQKSLVRMAKLGSPAAQKDVYGLIDTQSRNERKS